MKSWNQFKAENGVTTVDMLRGKGRLFAKVADNDLVVSQECVLTEPLFVIPLSKFNNGTDSTDGSTVIPNAFILINSSNVTIECSI